MISKISALITLSLLGSALSASAHGFGSYYCIRSKSEPKAVYLVTELEDHLGRAAKVTSKTEIKTSSLLEISSLVDSVLDNEDGNYEYYKTSNTARVKKYVIEAISMNPSAFPNSFYGYNKNASMALTMIDTETTAIMKAGMQQPVMQFKLVLPEYSFKLGPKTSLKNMSDDSAELTIQACGYYHDS